MFLGNTHHQWEDTDYYKRNFYQICLIWIWFWFTAIHSTRYTWFGFWWRVGIVQQWRPAIEQSTPNWTEPKIFDPTIPLTIEPKLIFPTLVNIYAYREFLGLVANCWKKKLSVCKSLRTNRLKLFPISWKVELDRNNFKGIDEGNGKMVFGLGHARDNC